MIGDGALSGSSGEEDEDIENVVDFIDYIGGGPINCLSREPGNQSLRYGHITFNQRKQHQ